MMFKVFTDTTPLAIVGGTRSVCVSVYVAFPFILDKLVDVPAGVTGLLIQLPSAVLALIYLARRIQPFLSLVEREVE